MKICPRSPRKIVLLGLIAVLGTSFSLLIPKTFSAPLCDPLACTLNENCTSPIVIDTSGGDFKMTSAEHGVVFDIFGTGKPIKISWTAPDSGVGFLALDRNGNGVIDDGGELFGTASLAGSTRARNGFTALAEFDKPENGGNDDDVISRDDAVFPRLLLWIDANHDGVSQRAELHNLVELGIVSISLSYRESPRVDRYGNRFVFASHVRTQSATFSGTRRIYDVYFTVPD